MSWVPLHVHSQYSILDSTAQVSTLASKAAEYGMTSLALTDQGNMYGVVEFYKACLAQKVKPILGCELYVAPFSRHEKKKVFGVSAGYPVVLLVKNSVGYKNLCKLSSLAHLEGFYYTARIDKALMEEFSEGLICLSGSLQGKIASLIVQEKSDELLQEIEWFHRVFKEDFYFEVQRHRMTEEQIQADRMTLEPWLYQKYKEHVDQQEKVIAKFKELSPKYGIPIVATNDSHYILRDEWRAHEILMNVQSGEPCEIWEKDSAGNLKAKVLNPKREVMPSHEFYFKTPQEMEALFSDLPDAIACSSRIADQCSFDLDFKTKYYPVYVPPSLENKEYTVQEREAEVENFLRTLCAEQIPLRYRTEQLDPVRAVYPDQDPMEVIAKRLDYELNLITSKGMSDYLLIVYDFIAWAKRNGIPMGPGRGSGAGSIILYLIGITDIEPLRFNLFFERFINPERISYPDIDVDICMDRRQEVIDYTVQKYGKDRVAQIITFGTMKAKMAIKDVGRVLSVPLPKVNAIAKLVPEDPNMTLEKALEIDAELKSQYENDPEVQNLIQIALKLEGSVRNTGIHAAGLIIGGQPLMDNIPLCLSKDSDMAVTQFSMKPVESVGLLKIDFLGLKTLTSIQKAVDLVDESYGVKLDWVNLPLNDTPTFDLLNQGKTQGIFQLESGGMQELAKQLRIDRFEEIIAVGALYRPGPMEMIPSFIQRKHGREPIENDHPFMAGILSETYGIMVYQEQVMQIASRLANYSLGEGDVLRRAMGKKDKEEMSRQREKFKNGALQNQIDEVTSMRIFDKIEKFASYGFNKSHAAAYGYLTYVTAYLKANYPSAWMASLMTSDRDDTAKVAKVIRECQSSGIAILSPDINQSGKEFTPTKEGIRFAMSGIKGIGEGVVETILTEKKANGSFQSLYDFIRRMDVKKIGKKSIEHLIEAGCFDYTQWSRAALIESIDAMYGVASKEQKEEAQGVLDFFSLMGEKKGAQFEHPPKVHKFSTKQQILKREYELLGFYLKEHPLDEFRHLFPKLSCCPLSELSNLDKLAICRIAFIIEDVSIKISAKTQKKFAILTIRDGLESYELPVWADLYEQHQTLLVETQLIYAVLQVEQTAEGIKLQAKWLADLTKVDETMLFACDAAYDKAKSMLKMAELREKAQANEKAKKASVKEEKPLMQTYRIVLNMDHARMSHILALKQIFRMHAGDLPVQMEFFSQNTRIGSLEIRAEWGIQSSKEIEALIKKIISVESITLVAK
ncbi:MAG: DNA polymerase III subunit alpha [Rhabdochlamydiaceae bacterium]|nr:DNA polymerase III subunit alpha [Rhabdochlamydiaceae bacterium]